MKAIEFLELTKDFASQYRQEAQSSLERNGHMNDLENGEVIHQSHIDAVLVDFINYMGMKQGLDYALYTSDLKEVKNSRKYK